jgi:virginiamycin B lyase
MVSRLALYRLQGSWVLIAVAAILSFSVNSSAQAPQRGTITGTVTADQGEVRGFRVTAHNLEYKLWYTVFTDKGKYTIPQALPGLYDVTVLELGYRSPTLPVRLAPGETKTADFAVKRHPQAINAGGFGFGSVVDADSPQFAATAAKTVWVNTMDELYPPGPGRDLLRANCTGCHGDSFGTLHYTKAGYRAGIAKMTETGPGSIGNDFQINLGRTILTAQQKDLIAGYLAANFGPPGAPDRKIRIEQPAVDEDVVSKSIYVSYDNPAGLPVAPMGNVIGADMVDGVIPEASARGRSNYLHDPFISPVDGTIWYADPVANAMLQLDPKQLDPERRWKVFPLKGTPYVFMHGITVDAQGRVYWAEIRGGMLGELDPGTGKQIRHKVPMPGSMLQVVTDKDQNIWFTNYLGGDFGKLDAQTRRIHMYSSPTPDNGLYGLAADAQGNIWGAGWQKGIVSKWDRETESVIDYPVPDAWGMVRRIGVDSKGIVWFSEYNVGILGALDPATGKITEYRLPAQGSHPYDVWPDNQDNIWIADHTHSSLVKFNQGTKKFTYYPETQLNQSVPKIEIEKNDTIWYGSRGVPHVTANHFYPYGYTAEAPPLP